MLTVCFISAIGVPIFEKRLEQSELQQSDHTHKKASRYRNRIDPAPNKDLSIEQQILQHLYRCENGAPNFRWGLRKDLSARMSASNTFHGQTKSPYELGEDLGRNESRFAPNGVLAQLAALPGGNALGSDLSRRD